MTKTLVTMTMIVVGAGVLCFVACNQRSPAPVVNFTFSPGFRGAVLIRREAQGGVRLEPKNGIYNLDFSDSQVILVRSTSFMSQTFLPRASYKNGQAIPYADGTLCCQDDAIALRNLGTIGPDDLRFFVVGTKSDAEKALKIIDSHLTESGRLQPSFSPPAFTSDSQ